MFSDKFWRAVETNIVNFADLNKRFLLQAYDSDEIGFSSLVEGMRYLLHFKNISRYLRFITFIK